MAYNSLISRSDAAALIPPDTSREIVQGVTESSAVMRLATRAPDMPRAQRSIPVLSALPTAYFVSGDIGLKQTTEQAWENKYLNAEELACIVPIPEAVLDDQDYDVWGEIRPRIVEAMGRVFDMAVLFGTNAPATWPTDVVTAAVAAGNSVVYGTNPDIYDDLLSENGVVSLVEADGYFITGHIADVSMRGILRGLRATDGQLIFSRNVQERNRYELDGEPVEFPRNGVFNGQNAMLICGDWSQMIYALRQDISYKVLTEAVIQDADGNIVYNLPQQDMVALRAVMRIAWQVPNPINRMEEDESERYPFGVLLTEEGS
ncbi:MAG: phage major capsid protein [Thermoprotei archaeon]|nr:MAG: phage major capsid protein [Thermoprotei archaeon]